MSEPLSSSARNAARRLVSWMATSDRLMTVMDLVAQETSRARDVRLAAGPPRTRYQMRRSLPADRASSISVRDIEPVIDAQALMELSLRAFAWDPDRQRLIASVHRMLSHAQQDPSSVLVHETDNRPSGYCWIRVPEGSGRGIVDTLAVDPDLSGRGIGRELCVAGLERLARSGLPSVALWVDADNVPALKTYLDLGFVVHEIVRDYGCEPVRRRR